MRILIIFIVYICACCPISKEDALLEMEAARLYKSITENIRNPNSSYYNQKWRDMKQKLRSGKDTLFFVATDEYEIIVRLKPKLAKKIAATKKDSKKDTKKDKDPRKDKEEWEW